MRACGARSRWRSTRRRSSTGYLVGLEGTAMLQRITSPQREYGATMVGLAAGFTRDPYPSHHCDSREAPSNLAGYYDPETDQLIEAIRSARDRETARPLWKEFQERRIEAEPFTPLYYQEVVTESRSRLQGAKPDVRGELVNVSRWWIVPSERDMHGSAAGQPGGV
jgi:ABC-type transport system substrate-binding protein